VNVNSAQSNYYVKEGYAQSIASDNHGKKEEAQIGKYSTSIENL